MPSYVPWIAAALLVVNAWAVLAFWQDKRAARLGNRRTPEARLLFLALIGGTPGTFYARQRFRHKTRKQPFTGWLWVIAGLQVAALIATVFLL